jgi:hypothetical protein
MSDCPSVAPEPSSAPVLGSSILFHFSTGRNAMQVSVMMVMALSGLGCQNKECEVFPTPQISHASSSCATNMHPGSAAPSGYPAYAPGGYGVTTPLDYTVHGAMRSTLWSFILGRDPDVASVRDIEATFDSGRYGASGYPGGYGK